MSFLLNNMWPIYVDLNNNISIDKKVYRALNDVFGQEDLVCFILNDVKNHIYKFDEASSMSQTCSPIGIIGPSGILLALNKLVTRKKVMFGNDDQWSSIVRVLSIIDRPDLLKSLVTDDFGNNPCPGVFLGVMSVIRDKKWDIELKKKVRELVHKPMFNSHALASFQKIGVMRSAIADARRGMASEDDLDEIEKIGEGHPQAVMSGDRRKAVMWMLNDPYKRIRQQEFNWDALPRTRDAIREVFPFALPNVYDLDKRSPDEILKGLLKIWSWTMDHVVMDPFVVDKLFEAHIRLMDISPATPSEINSGINIKMLSISPYIKDHKSYARRVARRIPKHREDITLYSYRGRKDILRDIVLILYNAGVLNKVNVFPVTMYEV